MLPLKILASLMVIISCSLIGYSFANKFSNRVKNLILLQNCLLILESEIVYSATPLPTALKNVYIKGNKKVSFIFNDISKYLIKNKNTSVLDSFYYVSDILKSELNLTNEDIEVFISLGRILGTSDRVDQQKHFKTILFQLKNQQFEAQEVKKKNEKLYKSLGILTGLTIVILLF